MGSDLHAKPAIWKISEFERRKKLPANEWKEIVFYFLIGGTLVSLVTYLSSHGKGFWAAFAATFPTITVLTFITAFKTAGMGAALNYAKGLIWITPAWLGYVGCVYLLLPRIGVLWSIISGVVFYIVATIIISNWGKF